MKNFKRKLGLNLFDGEASAEGGDNPQTTTPETTTPEPAQVNQPSDNVSVQQRAEAGFMSRLQALLSGGESTPEVAPNTDTNGTDDTRPNQDNNNTNDIEKRIADLEYREQQMAMKENGVTPDKLSDAMTLFKASGESDMAKFLEARPYLTAGEETKKEAQAEEPQPYKHELSDREKYLQQQGIL